MARAGSADLKVKIFDTAAPSVNHGQFAGRIAPMNFDCEFRPAPAPRRLAFRVDSLPKLRTLRVKEPALARARDRVDPDQQPSIEMAILYWVVGVICVLVLAGLLAGRVGMLSGTEAAGLGVRDGRLKGLSSTENCVSSQASLYPEHPQRQYAEIAPITLLGDGPATIARLVEVVQAMPGATIVVNDSDYARAQFTSRLLKFVDDVEFWYDPAAQVIQVRSASRVGRKDFGVNRQRIEAIRSALMTLVKTRALPRRPAA